MSPSSSGCAATTSGCMRPSIVLHGLVEFSFHEPTPVKERSGMTPTSTAAAEPLRIADASGALAAEFIPGLGMVGVSLQHDGEELLAQMRGPQTYVEHLKTLA